MSQYPPQGPWQQPQQWQGQPAQQPYYQQPPPVMPPGPPQQPPRKKSSRRTWIIIGVIVLILIIASAVNANKNNSSTSTVAATATSTTIIANTQAADTPIPPTATTIKATITPKLVTIQTFRGHSSGGNWYYSPYFSVANNWQVSWTCISGDTSLPVVTIAGYDHSGNPAAGNDNVAAHGFCSDLAGTGTMQQYGGTIRLQIYAQGDWTVTVREMK